jgi:glycerophosphoryl diester phosphodiesterase
VIADDAPENSLAAIRLAALHGYDMVELDVREARDGEPILFHGHGASLFVDCGIDRAVEDITSAEATAISYRASDEHIATLAQALALCDALDLGVMLDIKAGVPSQHYLSRIIDLIEENRLASSTLTISTDPLVEEHLAHVAMLRVSKADYQHVQDGRATSLAGQFWFGWAAELPSSAVEQLQRSGALVIPSINTFHYPAHAHRALAHEDIRRLREAGVEGFQIDSTYGDVFSL